MNVLARVYFGQEKYNDAEVLYRQSLSLQEQQTEPDVEEIVASLTNLASLSLLQGKCDDAGKFSQQALSLMQKAQGMNHDGTARCLIILGDFYAVCKKNFSEAEQLYHQALNIYQETLGLEHPDIFDPLVNLAGLAQIQERLEQAEVFYQQALQIAEKYPIKNTTLAALGYSALLEQMNRPEEAKLMAKRALVMQKEREKRELSLDE